MESVYTELLIAANAYRQFIECIANDQYDQYDRASPGLRDEARRILTEHDHPSLDPENYQG